MIDYYESGNFSLASKSPSSCLNRVSILILSQAKLNISEEPVILTVELGHHMCFIFSCCSCLCWLKQRLHLLWWELLLKHDGRWCLIIAVMISKNWVLQLQLLLLLLLCYCRIILLLAHLQALLPRKTQSLVNLRILRVHWDRIGLRLGSHREHLILVLGQSEESLVDTKNLHAAVAVVLSCIQSFGCLLIRRG